MNLFKTLLTLWLWGAYAQSTNVSQNIPLDLDFQGVKLSKNTVTLSLRNDEIDMSPVIQVIQQLKKTDYESDLNEMDYFINTLEQYRLADLCKRAQSEKTCIKTAMQKVEQAFNKVRQEKENDILYPPRYNPVGSGDKRTLWILNNERCKVGRFSTDLADIFFESSPAVYHQLMDKIKHNGLQMKEKILALMAEYLNESRHIKACLETENQNHRVCSQMKKDFEIKRDRFYEMAELVYGPLEDKTTIAKTLCFECETIQVNDEYDYWDNFVQTLPQYVQCVAPQPGEKTTVRSGTGTYTQHTLQREPDGSFTIPLDLKFVPAEDYDGDVPKDQVPAHWRNKVNECMKKANAKMLGPKGEKLNIVVPEPSKKKEPCPSKSQEIEIGPKRMRSRSKKYSPSVDCPTIVHEVLHLLGLCDEYEEKRIGFYVDSKTGEVMGNERSKPTDEFKAFSDCRVTSDENTNIMSKPFSAYPLIVEQDSDESLLTKGQFNAILYGACADNQLFNECSRLSTQGTIKSGFSDKYAIDESCLSLKKKCIEMNGMGDKDKAEEIKKIQAEIDYWENRRTNAMNDIQNPSKRSALTNLGPGGLKPVRSAVSEEQSVKPNPGPPELKPPGGWQPVSPPTKESLRKELNHANNELKALRARLKTVKTWQD